MEAVAADGALNALHGMPSAMPWILHLTKDSVMWLLAIIFFVLLVLPFAVIAHLIPLIGETASVCLWISMCFAVPIWAIWYGYRDPPVKIDC